jgi:hypothetical protein
MPRSMEQTLVGAYWHPDYSCHGCFCAPGLGCTPPCFRPKTGGHSENGQTAIIAPDISSSRPLDGKRIPRRNASPGPGRAFWTAMLDPPLSGRHTGCPVGGSSPPSAATQQGVRQPSVDSLGILL